MQLEVYCWKMACTQNYMNYVTKHVSSRKSEQRKSLHKSRYRIDEIDLSSVRCLYSTKLNQTKPNQINLEQAMSLLVYRIELLI